MATGSTASARCAESGRWPPSSWSRTGTKEPAAGIAAATVAGALERGLILLKTGIYDNVIRILVPVNASDKELNAGLDILEESLAAAAAA